jgi:drug/metabolite transporter (DMT)-like permease
LVSRRGSGTDLTLATLGAFGFGCTVLFQRAVARDGLHASVALGIRFACAGALLLTLLALLRRPLLPPRGERVAAVGVGLALYAVEATCFYMALERGTAAAVALIFYAYPAAVAAAEAVRGRTRPQQRIVAALLLAIGGSAVVAVGGGAVAITATGVAFVVVSIAVFSAYVIVSEQLLVRSDPLTAATWTALGASAGTFLFGAAIGRLEAPTAGALGALVANGVATGVAFTLFFTVLGRIGSTRTAIVMALEAVFAVLLAALFLGEGLRLAVAAGGAAVLAGAILAAQTTPAAVEVREGASPP